MALILRDIMELPILSSFRLVAGGEGLDRPIKRVNILDFEYVDKHKSVDEVNEPDGLFNPMSLVLATFLYAKDAPEQILPALKQLDLDGVSALAVKTVCFESLPTEVLDYADRQRLPIFLFKSTSMDAEYEDIVFEIMTAVANRNRFEDWEHDAERLLLAEPFSPEYNQIMENRLPFLSPPFCCCYYAPRASMPSWQFERFFCGLTQSGTSHAGNTFFSDQVYYLPYHFGFFVIFSGKSVIGEWDARVSAEKYLRGCSLSHTTTNEFQYALQESLQAENYAKRQRLNSANFADIGILQILLPNRKNYWLSRYLADVIKKINHAETGGAELYQTVEVYVKNQFDYSKTAEALSLHKNSVRYRISKAREILGYEEDSPEFQAAIYLAVLFNDI